MARRTPSQLNMLLAVDKPVGCTSHDVVSQCRRALHERRVGHAGTLDPMASGVMVVGVGQATRLLGMLTLDTKSYVADISFGVETNTDDAEGEAVCTVAVAPSCAILLTPVSSWPLCLARRCRCRQRFRPFRSMAFAPIRVLARAMRLSCPRAPSGLCRRPDRRGRRGRCVRLDRGVFGKQGHLHSRACSRSGSRLR